MYVHTRSRCDQYTAVIKKAYGYTVIFNTAIFLWYRYTAHPYHYAKKQRQLNDVRT